jgi:hypothetical protein
VAVVGGSQGGPELGGFGVDWVPWRLTAAGTALLFNRSYGQRSQAK